MAEGIVPVRKDFINQIKSIISEAQQNAYVLEHWKNPL
jgi:hypothetical protein